MAEYSFVRDETRAIRGMWIKDPAALQKPGSLEVLLVLNGAENLLSDYLAKRYRVVPNTYDSQGGCFIMFGLVMAPGEEKPPPLSKKWWQIWK